MKIPTEALKIAIEAVNAGQPELSYVEHVLTEAKAEGLFDGSFSSAVLCLDHVGMEVA